MANFNAHPDYEEGFFHARAGVGLPENETPEFKAGWEGWHNFIHLCEKYRVDTKAMDDLFADRGKPSKCIKCGVELLTKTVQTWTVRMAVPPVSWRSRRRTMMGKHVTHKQAFDALVNPDVPLEDATRLRAGASQL